MAHKKLSKEEEIRKAALEKEAYDHYFKIIESTLKWCVYDQPEEINTFFTAFGVNKKEITLKACEDVLRKWKGVSKDESI